MSLVEHVNIRELCEKYNHEEVIRLRKLKVTELSFNKDLSCLFIEQNFYNDYEIDITIKEIEKIYTTEEILTKNINHQTNIKKYDINAYNIKKLDIHKNVERLDINADIHELNIYGNIGTINLYGCCCIKSFNIHGSIKEIYISKCYHHVYECYHNHTIGYVCTMPEAFNDYFTFVNEPKLEKLTIDRVECSKLVNVNSNKFNMFNNLKYVQLSGMGQLCSIYHLKNVPEIELSYMNKISDLSPLQNAKKLIVDHLNMVENVFSLCDVQHLELHNMDKITDVDSLKNVPHLRLQYLKNLQNAELCNPTLRLMFLPNLKSFKVHEDIQDIKLYDLSQCKVIYTGSKCKKLEVGYMHYCSVDSLKDHEYLESLTLMMLNNVEDISGFVEGIDKTKCQLTLINMRNLKNFHGYKNIQKMYVDRSSAFLHSYDPNSQCSLYCP